MMLRLVGWLSLLQLPLALYLAQNYAPTEPNVPWFVPSTFYLAAVGHFFVVNALVALVLIAPITWWRQLSKTRFIYAAVILLVLNGLLALDAHVYALNRFHFTPAVFELFVHRGEPVTAISLEIWLSILWRLCFLLGYSVVVLLLAWYLAQRGLRCRFLAVLCLVMYVMANLIHAYADVKQIVPLVDIEKRLPWYYPLTMNTFLQEHGLMEVRPEQVTSAQLSQSLQRPLNYPRQELTYFSHVREPYNIVLITVPSLRADMLAPATMPHTYEWSRSARVYARNFAASNSTRGTYFSLLYGLTPSYWPNVLAARQEPALLTALKAKDYQLRFFMAFDPHSLGFSDTIFAGQNASYREAIYPVDYSAEVRARDDAAIAGFTEFVAAQTESAPKFFAWVALDGLRTYATSEAVTKPFAPANQSLNKLALGPKTDPLPVFNLYRNAVYYADTKIAKVLEALTVAGLADNTIVIFTSDHGEEFNDNGANYWGHNSNFSRVQMKVPLVIKWPQKPAAVITDVSVSYDLTATLLPQVLGVQNRIRDYSLGRNLLAAPTEPRKFLLVGSYLEQALLEPERIVVIDEQGRMSFKDWNYRPLSAPEPARNLFAAIRQMTAFLEDAPQAEARETSVVVQSSLRGASSAKADPSLGTEPGLEADPNLEVEPGALGEMGAEPRPVVESSALSEGVK